MNGNNITDTTTNVEPHSGNAPLGKEKTQGFDTPVHIHIHSVRKRLADSDGISGKACVDGIVKAGLLPDDSPQFVKAVSHSQEKGKEEYTVITLSEI